MILDGKGGELFAAESLKGIVVKVHMCQLNVLALERIQIDAEAVVLAGYFNPSGLEVLDVVVGFQYKSDAERFRHELEQRFRKFNLELNAEKTRLIEFGRFAAERRRSRGEGKPGTFDFLGFTHVCSKMRTGRFVVLRRPMKKRIRAKLKEIKRILRMYLHAPIAQVGQWLRAVLNGWYRYYGVPLTFEVLGTFCRQVAWLWFRSLRRRSQKSRMTWRRMHLLINRWLPRPRIMHPYRWNRLRVRTQGRSPVQ